MNELHRKKFVQYRVSAFADLTKIALAKLLNLEN